MEKAALIERLVRLGATDVPNTPRLLMRKRSPAELAGLQHGVENAFGKLQGPAQAAVDRAADKTFTPRIAGALKSVASVGIKNPEIIPMQAVPVPGLTPAYLAGKRGLEKFIDKVAPLAKHAFTTSEYSYPLNPSIPSQASSAPAFRAPSLQSAVQKHKQANGKSVPPDELGHVEYQLSLQEFGETKGRPATKAEALSIRKEHGIPSSWKFRPLEATRGETHLLKNGAGAPTRGNFMMASDVPSFSAPDLKNPIQKRSGASGLDEPNQGVDKVGDLDFAFDPAPTGKKKSAGIGAALKKIPPPTIGEAIGGVLASGAIAHHIKGELNKQKEKDSDMLPDYVTYNAGDFKRSKYAMPVEEMSKFVGQLREKMAAAGGIMGVSPSLGGATSAAKSVGAPKLSGPGPSIAQIAKPKGPHFGTGIAGAFKGSIGGRAPQDLS